MIIKHITLENFRNYGRLDLDVGPSVNIVYGNNAQGKTNIIEAINVCSCVSSHRTSKDKDMIKFGEDGYSVNMNLHDEVYDSDVDLNCGYKNVNNVFKRELEHDGIKISKISDYMGICNTVIFAPEDLNLIKSSPSVRRKYLNMLIMKVSPTYVDLLGRTNKIMNQKVACLKSFKGDYSVVDNNMLDFWDFSLADLSAELILYRLRYSYIISSYACKHHEEISGGLEKLSIVYNTTTGAVELVERFLNEREELHAFISGTLSEGILSEIKGILSEFLLKKLRNNRKIDVEKGIMMSGVHHDDLDIKINGLVAKVYSSQGQQRSAALSLKLAELEIIRSEVKSTPILLLDDVFSELDMSRRRMLLSVMKDAQIFITCTDKSYIQNELGDFLGTEITPYIFKVNNGVVIREN